MKIQPWIKHNLVDLKDAGWTNEGLFNNCLPRGLNTLKVWEKPNVSVTLEDGTVCFRCVSDTGADILQTARPK